MELIKLKTISAGYFKCKLGNITPHCKLKSPVISKKPATQENFNIVSEQDKFWCRFCCVDTDSTHFCKKYTCKWQIRSL